MSVASADPLTCSSSSQSTPIFCYSINGGTSEAESSLNGVNWNGSNGGSAEGFWTLIQNQTPVNITLAFNSDGDGSGSFSNDTYTIALNGNFKSDSQSKILQLSSSGKGIDMQGKTLTFDFGTRAPSGNWGKNDKSLYRKMILDLSNVGSSPQSFKGNIAIISGRAQGWYGENQFEATFGKDVIGNITINPYLNYSDITSTFTFSNNASLQGNISITTGNNTYKFDSGTIEGTISATGGTNNIIATGANQVFKTNIFVDGNGGSSGLNTFAFGGTDVSLGESNAQVTITATNRTGNGAAAASNLVLLNGSASNKVYLSELKMDGSDWLPEKLFNVLSFNGSANTLVIDSITARQGSNVIGKDYLTIEASSGKAILNNNLFNNGGEAITASFMQKDNAANFSELTIGTVAANVGARNFININGELSIQSLSSYAGTNYIRTTKLTFKGDQKNISGTGGGNYLIIDNGSDDVNVVSNLAIDALDGYSGTNALALTGGNVTLGDNGEKITITATNDSGNGAAIASNLVLFNGSISNKAYISELTMNGSSWQPTKLFNILSFNGDGASTLTIDSITAKHGNNVIGKGYLATDTSGNAILSSALFSGGEAKLADFMSGSNSATFNTLTIGTVSANAGGKNFININGALSLESLSANAGYNYIRTTELTLRGGQKNISGTGGGNYLIINNNTSAVNIVSNLSIDGNGGYSGTNALALTGGNVTLGSSSEKITITATNSGGNGSATASNLVLFNGSTNNQTHISNLTMTGSSWLPTKLFNILSFNGRGTNTLTIDSITAKYGNNVIGKDYLATDTSGNAILSSALFSNGEAVISNFMQADNAATFTAFTVGKVIANSGGSNFINMSGSANINEISASSGNNYISSSLIVSANISASNGSNQITISGTGTSTLGAVNAYAGKNTFYFSNARTAQIDAIDNGAFSLSAKASGNKVGQNILNFAGSGTTLTLTSMTLDNDNKNNHSAQSAANYLNLAGTANNITIGSMNTGSKNNQNVNVLAKNILTGDITSGYAYITGVNADTYMGDTHAFEGVLKITNGMTSGLGTNIISYKATSSTTSTIIGANTETGNAITGGASIYLDVSASGISSGIDALESIHSASDLTTLSSKAVIAGNILGSSSTPTNIKIVGKANTQASLPYATNTNTNNAQIGILGNIATDSGATTNIVMQDSFFASSAVIKSGENTQTILGGEKFGNITNNGGTTNIVTRFDVDPNFDDAAIYNVTNNSGTTNVVLQGDLDIGANVTYGSSGEINFIFANANNINPSPNGTDGNVITDTFATQMDDPTKNGSSDPLIASTDTSANRILGVTYKDGLKLTLADKTIKVGDSNVSFVDTYGHYFTETNGGKTSTFVANRTTQKDTINIKGLVLGTISTLEGSSAKSYDVTIAENSAFVGNVTLTQNSNVTLTMNQGSKLLTDSDVFYVKKLKIADNNAFNIDGLILNTFAQNNTIIDLATMGSDLGNVEQGRENFRLFAVGVDGQSVSADTGLQGKNALFRVYVNDKASQTEATKLGGQAVSQQNGYFYADRVVIADIGNQTDSATTAQTHYLQVIADGLTDLGSIHYNEAQNGGASSDKGGTAIKGNIAVATVKNGTAITSNDTKAIVEIQAQDVIQGFDQVGTTLTAKVTDQYGMTDASNSGGWTTYFVDSMSTKGATSERGELSAATLATNYDLYMANFNSLNKRMGELRDNANSQGVWARVFNGTQSNDMGLGTKTSYTTFQGGYDYALGMEGANNYIGLAVSYSMSSSEVQGSLTQALDQNILGFDNVKSSAVEVAVYNSYVQDEGWYNDSIFKFSYIMSDFNIFGQNTTYNTNNMAFTLSDEFGYRFKLGEAKEWYIDPQAEFSFGYFDQSELKQTLGDAWLNTIADSVMTLRSRFGSSFGYDFKQFTQGKGIDAKLYVGAFYEYDYVTGGDVSLTTNLGGETVSSSAISSDGRVVVNVGTNMTVKENTRIYFDFETSFAGKIRTDYQINAGVRYSFGENYDYLPMNENTRVSAPLKVSDENAEESEETQESTQTTTSEQTSEANKESADSKDNKTEESTEAKSEEKAQ